MMGNVVVSKALPWGELEVQALSARRELCMGPKKKSWNEIVGDAKEALSFSSSHARKRSPVVASRTNQSF